MNDVPKIPHDTTGFHHRKYEALAHTPGATTPPHFTVELVCNEETLPLEEGGGTVTHDWYEMARLLLHGQL